MGYDDGIVIDVGHPCIRPDCLGDLVGVVGRWEAAADVYELADAQVAGQVPDRAPQETTVLSAGYLCIGQQAAQFLGRLPVGSEIILSAKKVVVDPRNVRDGDIERSFRNLVTPTVHPSPSIRCHVVTSFRDLP